MIEFRILGSLEVVDGDHQVALGGPRQRALLTVLLVHRNELVSSDRLIDELWSERAPPSAIKVVQGYVSNLRKVLGDGVLVTRGHGYLLRADKGQLDSDRFESLAAAGRRALHEGDARAAAERLREALALWRGEPLADCAYDTFAQPEIARLGESRMAALEDRIDAELALGEHSNLVGELEALVHEHPSRERFESQLMLALYRSGRQADALESYRLARGRMAAELGIAPGRGLQQLERAILTHDPGLEAPAREARQEPRALPRPPPRSAAVLAAGVAILLAAVALITARLTDSGTAAVRAGPNSLAAIDPQSNRVVDVLSVGARPAGVVFGSGSLWVANLDDQTVSRIDPRTLQTLRAIVIGRPPTAIAATAHRVWVLESSPNPDAGPGTTSVLVGRVDPEFDTLSSAARIRNVAQSGPGALAAQGNSVWIAPSTGLLTRLNATTGAVARRLDPNASPRGIAIGAGAVWLSDSDAGAVVRMDPTGLPTPITVGNGPAGLAVGGGGVWVADSLDNNVVRIDPGTRSVTSTVPVGRSPAAVAVGAGSVWVANSGDGTVTRINPQTGSVEATIAVGGSPQALTVADGRVWVTVDAQSITPARPGSGDGTLRLLSAGDVDNIDPALAYTGLSLQLVSATCASLLTYPDRAGAAASVLTPEVAQELPTRSADGRTYTFRIRPGFRFSPPSGQAVTAETFKKTIERTLSPRLNSPLGPYLADVVGASAYTTGKARHIAGVVAVGDTLTIHLRAASPDFLSRMALPAFCAVPPNTPVTSNVRGIPSAGPYYAASYTPGQSVVLKRNPNYRGFRPHHFARIELSVGISDRQAVAKIQAGDADFASLGVAAARSTSIVALAARLAARYGAGSAAASRRRQRYFVSPSLELDAFALNTHRPLFSDVRLRQAVNYAIDRRSLARLGSGFESLSERPIDHYLPPGMPGFVDGHVYPMTPDLVKARHLVQSAHAGGRTAVLYTINISPFPEQAQIVKSDLAAIGINVEIRRFTIDGLFARLRKPGEPFDLGYMGWLADYPDPSQMLNQLIGSSQLIPSLRDPTSRRRLARTARLSGPQRYLSYGALDLSLARNLAPLAAYGNASSDDFFSARIGCQAYGIYGVDFAALCTRREHS